MIRNLLATTAIATLLASGAYAQETTTPAPADPAPMTQDAPATADATTTVDGHLASNIIGETVYNGTGDDAENIGEVNDIVLNAEGAIESVIIGVGGFLGIGEKNVAVEYSEVDWAERDGDRWMVIAATKEQLEQQTAFDPAPYEPVPPAVATDTTAPAGTMAPVDPAAPAADDTAAAPADPAAPATDDTATAPADPAAPATDDTAAAPAPVDPAAPATDTAEAPAADPAAPATDDTAAATPPADPAAPAATDTTQTAAIDRSTLTEVPVDQIRSEDLVGTTVYGADDANVGEIGDVVLNADGQVDAVVIDVGGFLGVGEKEVAVAMDNLQFMQDASDTRYLYTTFTKEQLDAAAAYDESTYAENRDQQRLMMQ